ncbi:spore coat protein YlbD [Camelliibacillus cellulosilyticus]|uniref:Spore coat protein YlbD n=1 Tax=Camelliibacillus cellulosilyticus TaxID=2174486 RepID=A0ABV9GGG0_9BACL
MGKPTEATLKAFKAFVRKHPELIKGVKEQGKSWKDIFDEWVLFGEDHEIWESYGIETGPKKKSPIASEMMRFLDFLSNLDAENVQQKLAQFNGALTDIQNLIAQFQPQQNEPPMNANVPQNNYYGPFPETPVNFRRD